MTYDKVFVDSDIFLDLFLKRTPFFIYSRSLLSEEDGADGIMYIDVDYSEHSLFNFKERKQISSLSGS